MKKNIKVLEAIGENSSIKQFETAHEMLLNQGISTEMIDELVNSNQALICAWAPDEDDEDKKITH